VTARVSLLGTQCSRRNSRLRPQRLYPRDSWDTIECIRAAVPCVRNCWRTWACGRPSKLLGIASFMGRASDVNALIPHGTKTRTGHAHGGGAWLAPAICWRVPPCPAPGGVNHIKRKSRVATHVDESGWLTWRVGRTRLLCEGKRWAGNCAFLLMRMVPAVNDPGGARRHQPDVA